MVRHLNSVTEEYKLDGKVSAIVTDNAKNMINATEKLPYVGIGCAAHSLQLSVNKGLKESNLDTLLAKVQQIVGSVHRSGDNLRELKHIMQTKGEYQKTLVSITK